MVSVMSSVLIVPGNRKEPNKGLTSPPCDSPCKRPPDWGGRPTPFRPSELVGTVGPGMASPFLPKRSLPSGVQILTYSGVVSSRQSWRGACRGSGRRASEVRDVELVRASLPRVATWSQASAVSPASPLIVMIVVPSGFKSVSVTMTVACASHPPCPVMY